MLADLRATLGPDRARAEPLELALYARDAGVASGHAAAVCFPHDARELAAAVRVAARHDRPFVAVGSGTGLAGGATPVGDPLVIVTTRLNQILEIDEEQRVAWVEPGVLNLDLTRAVTHLGLHYAPDPSSQQACTIGGNVATNAGGPHCLASGVTATHVLAIEVVLADGSTTMLGGLEPDSPGYDLRGCFVGSEGTMGIATRIAVRLTPNPPAVRTLLLDFTAIEDAGAAVSGIIAAGIVPAALEMMDAEITRAVEDYVGAGYPRDAAAVLLVELDGLPDGVDMQVAVVERVGRENRARSVRVAADEAERALLWKGRKSAFGAIARIAPDYYLHDAVVPRHAPRRRAEAGVRDRSRAAAHDDERLPCGRRQPAPADRVRLARPRSVGTRPPRRRRDPRRVCRRRRCALGRTRDRAREARRNATRVLGGRPGRAGTAARRVRSVGAREPGEDPAEGEPVR